MSRFVSKPTQYRALMAVTLMGIGVSANAADFEASLGGVALLGQSHVIGEEDDPRLLPYANLSYGRYSLSPDGLGVAFDMGQPDTFNLILGYRESAVDSGNDELTMLDERDSAVELTASWVRKTRAFELSFSATTDISSAHEGYELGAGISFPRPFMGGFLIPGVELSYQSDKLVNYYYGVSASEASGNITQYESDGSWLTSAGVDYIHPIAGNWASYTNVSWQNLGDGISDSPIVERSSVWSGVIGVFYKF